ncbi:hypothetical protein BMB171_C2768 [Bacillus thuringiensis BMB171]|nr:hypothetical protein BMB171_C2768 [Bacillus thuringiensis BMB171]
MSICTPSGRSARNTYIPSLPRGSSLLLKTTFPLYVTLESSIPVSSNVSLIIPSYGVSFSSIFPPTPFHIPIFGFLFLFNSSILSLFLIKQIVYLYIRSFPFIFHMSYLTYFQVKTLALQFLTT